MARHENGTLTLAEREGRDAIIVCRTATHRIVTVPSPAKTLDEALKAWRWSKAFHALCHPPLLPCRDRLCRSLPALRRSERRCWRSVPPISHVNGNADQSGRRTRDYEPGWS